MYPFSPTIKVVAVEPGDNTEVAVDTVFLLVNPNPPPPVALIIPSASTDIPGPILTPPSTLAVARGRL